MKSKNSKSDYWKRLRDLTCAELMPKSPPDVKRDVTDCELLYPELRDFYAQEVYEILMSNVARYGELERQVFIDNIKWLRSVHNQKVSDVYRKYYDDCRDAHLKADLIISQQQKEALSNSMFLGRDLAGLALSLMEGSINFGLLVSIIDMIDYVEDADIARIKSLAKVIVNSVFTEYNVYLSNSVQAVLADIGKFGNDIEWKIDWSAVDGPINQMTRIREQEWVAINKMYNLFSREASRNSCLCDFINANILNQEELTVIDKYLIFKELVEDGQRWELMRKNGEFRYVESDYLLDSKGKRLRAIIMVFESETGSFIFDSFSYSEQFLSSLRSSSL